MQRVSSISEARSDSLLSWFTIINATCHLATNLNYDAIESEVSHERGTLAEEWYL